MTDRVAHRPAALTNPAAIYATGLLGMGYADIYVFLIPIYALSLGMSNWQAMREVILPQAVRRVMPVLASTWVSLFKDTSLVSVIAVGDLAYTSMRIRSQSFRVLEMLTAMAAIYWALGYPQAKLVDWLNRKYGINE